VVTATTLSCSRPPCRPWTSSCWHTPWTSPVLRLAEPCERPVRAGRRLVLRGHGSGVAAGAQRGAERVPVELAGPGLAPARVVGHLHVPDCATPASGELDDVGAAVGQVEGVEQRRHVGPLHLRDEVTDVLVCRQWVRAVETGRERLDEDRPTDLGRRVGPTSVRPDSGRALLGELCGLCYLAGA